MPRSTVSRQRGIACAPFRTAAGTLLSRDDFAAGFGAGLSGVLASRRAWVRPPYRLLPALPFKCDRLAVATQARELRAQPGGRPTSGSGPAISRESARFALLFSRTATAGCRSRTVPVAGLGRSPQRPQTVKVCRPANVDRELTLSRPTLGASSGAAGALAIRSGEEGCSCGAAFASFDAGGLASRAWRGSRQRRQRCGWRILAESCRLIEPVMSSRLRSSVPIRAIRLAVGGQGSYGFGQPLRLRVRLRLRNQPCPRAVGP
jgi:hypothetical protein